MKKNIFLLFIVCAFQQVSFSQYQQHIDSLKADLNKTNIHTDGKPLTINDTAKSNILYKLASAYSNQNPDTALIYSNQLLKLSEQNGYKIGIARAYMIFGIINYNQSAFTRSLFFLKRAMQVFEEINNNNGVSFCYQYIGYNYWRIGNFPDAIKNHLTALKIDEGTGNKTGICANYNGIGTAYLEQHNYSEALKNYSLCLKLGLELNNNTLLEKVYNNIGIVYQNQGKYPEAKKNLLLSLKYSIELGNTIGISASYLALSDFYFQTNDYIESLNHAFASFEIIKKSAFKNDPSWAYLFIGRAYTAQRNYTEATVYLNKALVFSKEIGDLLATEKCYRWLATLDSGKGNYKQALNNYQMYNIFHDSLFNAEKAKKTSDLQMQYEFDKKEDSLKQKQIITETKLHLEKKQKYFYWAGLGLLAILSFFIFLNFYNQKKINKLATESYANERNELELQSLRAQMNPHFIFNCINSIDAYIHSNEKYNATFYLNKFAKLLRNILDSSKENMVPFSKDIETLKLYVELEELRNENKFKSIISIDEELLTNDYKVPPLIIQPFVENAILHGLKNKEGNYGLLQVTIKKADRTIQYSIADNGIGREAAGKIPQSKESSYGMTISFDRIKLFNKEKTPSVTITDLYDKSGIVNGTLVTVKLKLV